MFVIALHEPSDISLAYLLLKDNLTSERHLLSDWGVAFLGIAIVFTESEFAANLSFYLYLGGRGTVLKIINAAIIAPIAPKH